MIILTSFCPFLRFRGFFDFTEGFDTVDFMECFEVDFEENFRKKHRGNLLLLASPADSARISDELSICSSFWLFFLPVNNRIYIHKITYKNSC